MGLIKLRIKRCKNCKENKELRWRPNQEFCSIKCFGEWEKGKNNPYYKGEKLYTCAECGKKFYAPQYRSRTKEQFCSQKCAKIKMGKNRLRENHPNWKNGRQKTPRGYIYILKKDHPFANSKGYIMEHRLVMEKKLGRYLTKVEVVHHINHKLDDNRIENLLLFATEQEHMKFHQPKGKQIGKKVKK